VAVTHFWSNSRSGAESSSSSPECPQMQTPMPQLQPMALSDVLVYVWIILGGKNPQQHNNLICHFPIQISLLMQELHHKNEPWISSYFRPMDYVCFCFISQGLVAVLARLRFSWCCSLKCFIFHHFL